MITKHTLATTRYAFILTCTLTVPLHSMTWFDSLHNPFKGYTIADTIRKHVTHTLSTYFNNPTKKSLAITAATAGVCFATAVTYFYKTRSLRNENSILQAEVSRLTQQCADRAQAHLLLPALQKLANEKNPANQNAMILHIIHTLSDPKK
jgi:hypothetical protein